MYPKTNTKSPYKRNPHSCRLRQRYTYPATAVAPLSKGDAAAVQPASTHSIHSNYMSCINLRGLECAEEAHNPINPTLNAVGVQCGEIMPIPMRVEDTLQHNYHQSSVPTALRIRVYVHTPHGTSLRVGIIRLRAESTYIGH